MLLNGHTLRLSSCVKIITSKPPRERDMSDPEGPPSHSGARNFVWIVVSMLLVVVVGYNLYSGATVKKIGIPGIFQIEFGERPDPVARNELDRMDKQELLQRQAELERKLQAIEKDVNRADPSPSDPRRPQQQQQARSLNVTGSWQSAAGLTYVLQQNGNYVAFQEINPIYGITAVGEGTIAGRVLDISYTTALGTIGKAHLRVSADGQHMSGTATDLSTGGSSSLNLLKEL